MQADSIGLSRFLSYVLRHRPDAIGAALSADGWIAIDELIAKSAAAGTVFDEAQLRDIVSRDAKQRYTISSDGRRIRAAQGHSVDVSLGLAPQPPPDVLYHGTASRFVESIMREGLRPGSRQQVHLSADRETAVRVGRRHGSPVVLHVAAGRMHAAGHAFLCADNGVWLTDRVPAEYLTP